jgi:Flp pilus assembly protein CpaB
MPVRKWSSPSKAFVALGVVLALSAFLVVKSYADRARALDASLGHPVPVVEAAEDIGRGAVLSATMLRVRSYPSGFAPPGAIAAPDGAVGRVALTSFAAGEPLTTTRLGPTGAGPIASLVPAGFQAVQLPTSLSPGSVRPGDRIDVFATFGGAHAHTETVASGLEVLRIGGPSGVADGAGFAGTGTPAESGTTLSLLVTPDDAEHIAFARAFADLWVVIDGAQEEVVAPEGP